MWRELILAMSSPSRFLENVFSGYKGSLIKHTPLLSYQIQIVERWAVSSADRGRLSKQERRHPTDEMGCSAWNSYWSPLSPSPKHEPWPWWGKGEGGGGTRLRILSALHQWYSRRPKYFGCCCTYQQHSVHPKQPCALKELDPRYWDDLEDFDLDPKDMFAIT